MFFLIILSYGIIFWGNSKEVQSIWFFSLSVLFFMCRCDDLLTLTAIYIITTEVCFFSEKQQKQLL